MKEYGGYLFIIDTENIANTLIEKIERDYSFTDAIVTSGWQGKKAEIFLISFYGSFSYAALAHRGNRIVTGKNLVRFTNFVKIFPEIPIQEIKESLEKNLLEDFNRSSKGEGQRTPPQTWSAVIALIKKLRPEVSSALDELYKLKDENLILPEKESMILAEEKDAVNIALRIAGFDEADIVDWTPPKANEQVSSFLKGLKNVSVIEDRMIEQDARVFGNWTSLESYIVGAVEFRKGEEQLTIINANRSSVEHSMGVDLVYYFEKFDSYLIIQYKRMDVESGSAVYRPIDKSYEDEIKKLRGLRKVQQSLPFSPNKILRDYRLNPESAYFKLCPKIVFQAMSTEMVKGMYIPLDYWEELLNSPNARGSRNGLQITYENVERYINNTLFISLAQSGWIGSRVISSKQLSIYIRAALEDNRSMMFAVDKTELQISKTIVRSKM